MFSKKSIRVLIQNTAGEFKEGVNTYEFKNLPIEAVIKRNGTESSSTIKIYGISKEHINSITRLPELGINQDAKLNVALFVDDGEGETLLYTGTIRDACPHYTSAPDVYIEIQCVALAFQNLMGDIPPHSFTRGASAPDMYKAVCASYGVPCVDLTVEKEIAQNPPFLNQKNLKFRLDALKEAYKKTTYTEWNTVVYIYNVGKEKVKYTVTPKDYIGYPNFNQFGIGLKFDKLIAFRCGEAIEVKGSELDMVNCEWSIVTIEYNISTKIGGKWEMNITCNKFESEQNNVS